MKKIIIGACLFAAGIAAHYAADVPYLSAALLLAAYAISGAEVIAQACKHLIKGRLLDEFFLMTVASIGALALGDFAEAAAVMLLFNVGEYFQDRAVAKSKKSIADLMDIRPDYANKLVRGETVTVSPTEVSPGDLIVVKPGEKIPLDGTVEAGRALLDMRSLTGEPLPKNAEPGDGVLSGCVNLDGLLTVRVTKPYSESAVSKILELTQNAATLKAPAERFITAFARYYTPVVVVLAVLLAFVPPLFLGGFGEWLSRALIFLVISCPCAVVISVPLTYFGGIGAASRNGVLVKGANFLDALSNLDIAVFDKTGTLTRGAFQVTGVHPAPGFDKERLLSLAAQAESFSNHPIARAIAQAHPTDTAAVTGYEETAGSGVSALIGEQRVLAGSERFLRGMGVKGDFFQAEETAAHVSVNGSYAGCITTGDTLRPRSAEAVQALRTLGVRKAVMLTGDHARPAQTCAEALSLDAYYAQLLPQDKTARLEALDAEKRPGGQLAFIGDGINDAPVLARADIGVAMGGLGSDAAIEAADVVLMTDEPYQLVTAVRIARKTRSIAQQNIVFALGVKLLIMALGALGFANMWAAVFADVGVSLIAVANALRVLRAGDTTTNT